MKNKVKVKGRGPLRKRMVDNFRFDLNFWTKMGPYTSKFGFHDQNFWAGKPLHPLIVLSCYSRRLPPKTALRGTAGASAFRTDWWRTNRGSPMGLISKTCSWKGNLGSSAPSQKEFIAKFSKYLTARSYLWPYWYDTAPASFLRLAASWTEWLFGCLRWDGVEVGSLDKCGNHLKKNKNRCDNHWFDVRKISCTVPIPQNPN